MAKDSATAEVIPLGDLIRLRESPVRFEPLIAYACPECIVRDGMVEQIPERIVTRLGAILVHVVASAPRQKPFETVLRQIHKDQGLREQFHDASKQARAGVLVRGLAGIKLAHGWNPLHTPSVQSLLQKNLDLHWEIQATAFVYAVGWSGCPFP